MRGLFRLVCQALLTGALLLSLGGALAPASAQIVTPQAQRPFSQLIETWTRQLDRISTRADQPDVLAVEIDGLREETGNVRAAAIAAAQLARNELADTRKLLAPLEPRAEPDKQAADQPPETEAVKAERLRLTEQAGISEGRIKQCEVVIARADQLLERLTKIRGEVMLQTLLHRGLSPLSPETWRRVGPEFTAAIAGLARALTAWRAQGLSALGSGEQDLTPLIWWALLTIVLWWIGHAARRRFGRGDLAEPGPRDRTIAAAIDGLGLVLVPVLAVWLIGKLLLASQPPAPIDGLIGELTARLITFLLVIGLTATTLSPHRPAWRVLPFTDAAARHQSAALRHLMAYGLAFDFVHLALTSGPDHDALSAFTMLAVTIVVAIFALPALANRAWEAQRPEGSDLPPLVGGTWWATARVLMTAIVLSSIVLALFGFARLGTHLNNATAWTCLLIGLAVIAHRLMSDLLEAIGAPDTASGRWVRKRFGLADDAKLRGQPILLLLFDAFLVVVLALLLPAAWGADTDAIQRTLEQLLHGVKIGNVTLSFGNLLSAILAFAVVLLLARLTRRVVRDRVMPTVDAPLRQSIDAGLNYVGVILAILLGVGALGIDFTNLAIVLGALSVGIGLGLQNIANNVISGVILLVERPIKAGDWVSVSGHEGFVRHINIRATEIETFQRTSVIVPNSIFLQNPVINRTYSDTSSRIDIQLTVGLGTDVPKLEGILRETALGNPRVLRVPMPIVRFARVKPDGLDFELFVFVGQLEDRQVVANDLNRTLLARLIEEKIIDPRPVPELRLHDLDKIAAILKPASASGSSSPPSDAAAPPTS